MGIISKQYIKQFVCRYDKEVGIPYYSYQDFKELICEPSSFINSLGTEIHYFFYNHKDYNKDKTILFCPGIGPGHTAYLKEIATLAEQGYRVLTLDYTGCGESKGKYLGSLNMPTLDVMELVDHLKIKEEIILVGHSLGAYTSLNVINLRNDIHTAVIISGFLSVESLINVMVKKKFIAKRINKYERKCIRKYSSINNLNYLKDTKDRLLFIHSKDDQMVPYSISTEVVESLHNPSIKTIVMDKRKHNPNYTDDAINYMNEVFGKYLDLINNKTIKSDEDKINYFKDVSLEKLTEQDSELFKQIYKHIEGVVLESDRFYLRRITRGDRKDLSEIYQDKENMKYFGKPYDDETLDRLISWTLDNYQKYGFGFWAIIDKKTGEFIGDCGLTMQNIDGELLPEIGYHIKRKYHNQGYASEAAKLVKDYIFKNYPFESLYGYTEKENIPSIKVMINNGMTLFKEYKKDEENLVVYKVDRPTN